MSHIYVHEASAPELNVPIPYSIEYIRKDALLEWAKEQYKHLDGTTIKNLDSPYWGQMVAFQKLIDKLNSL